MLYLTKIWTLTHVNTAWRKNARVVYDPLKLCLRHPRLLKHINLMLPNEREWQLLFSDLVNFARGVKCCKHYLTCNGIRMCCTGKHHVLETSQWEEWKKYGAVSIIVPFTVSFQSHHNVSVMELGHLFTRSGLTYPEVSSKVCHDFCQLGNSVSKYVLITNSAGVFQS